MRAMVFTSSVGLYTSGFDITDPTTGGAPWKLDGDGGAFLRCTQPTTPKAQYSGNLLGIALQFRDATSPDTESTLSCGYLGKLGIGRLHCLENRCNRSLHRRYPIRIVAESRMLVKPLIFGGFPRVFHLLLVFRI